MSILREILKIRLIVSALNVAMLVLIGLIVTRAGVMDPAAPQTQDRLFLVLVTAGAAQLAAAVMIVRGRLAPEDLVAAFKSGPEGPAAALKRLRNGAVLAAALGEACSLYGIAFYLISGDINRPWVFIALNMIVYLQVKWKISQASSTLTDLANAAP